MKIAIYGRTDKGGLKTHILSLVKELSKRHSVNIISQETLRSRSVYGGLYFIDPNKTREVFQSALRDVDIFHIHHPSTSSELFSPNFESNTPMVNTFHLSIGNKFINAKAYLLNKTNIFFVNFLAKKYSKRAYKYIAVGSRLSSIVSKYNNTEIINNGVDTNLYKPKQRERFFEDFTVGYIGRLDPEKNVINLIKACKGLDIPLVICGYSREFEHIKNTYESPRIKFFGEVVAHRFYNKIDLFVSPSMMEANIPLTILEAMSSGIPVITGNCGGEESKIKGSFGIITTPDAESIKKNIKKIMKADYKSMGKNARKEAKKHFNLHDKVRQIERIYKEAVDS